MEFFVGLLMAWALGTLGTFIFVWVVVGREEATYFPFDNVAQMIGLILVCLLWPYGITMLVVEKYVERQKNLENLRFAIEQLYDKDWYD